jgi:TonB family protein
MTRVLRCLLLAGIVGLGGPWGAAQPKEGEVFDVAAVDEVPVPLLQPKPALPAGVPADPPPAPVEVTLIVDEQGVVKDARVVKEGAAELDRAAVAILSKWRFRPGRKDGRPVASRLVVPVVFSIPDGEPSGPFAAPALVPVEELDRMPMVRYQEAPAYPPDLRRRGIGGEVLVEFVIDERGLVRMPRVLRAPHEALGEAAEVAVAQWTFFPGMKNGRAVATRLQVPIEFSPSAR